MSITARITITSGPDRGKVFELNDQLVNIGRGSKNDVALSDPSLSEHQASITSRGSRYAIYTPLERGVEVDGSVIPADRWVWLPRSARVRVSDRTAFQFSYQGGPGTDEADELAEMLGTKSRSSQDSSSSQVAAKAKFRQAEKAKRSAGKRPEKKKREVARFIVDQAGGDPLVKLGEDGHLPELALTEGPQKKALQKHGKQSNPALLYAAVAFGFCASILMLFVDVEPSGSSASQKTQARRAIAAFYETGENEPQEHQRHLREAQLAHSRGDRIAERRAYRRVLDLLNSEDHLNSEGSDRFTGLTGSLKNDEKLRRLIAVLISN